MSNYRKKILWFLLFLIPLGFLTKFYHGSFAWWVNGHLGGVFYEIFWIFVVAFIRPQFSSWKITVWVLMITCFLEFTQLWHPLFLVPVRQNFIGRTLIGDTFMWNDFPYYFLGCGIGWMILGKFESRNK